jgi:integrase
MAGATGIYYRPRADGAIGPPYEFAYLDLTGKRRWQVTHGTLEEARRHQAKRRIRRPAPAAPTSLAFTEYAASWLGRKRVRPRTLERYSWSLEQHLLPRLGRYELTDITPELIAELIAEMERNSLKGWTISTAMQPLAMILADASRKGHIDTNPMNELDRRERPHHTDQRPRRILSLDEMRALLEAADTPKYRCLLELLLTTGLRIGEALGLTAGDLDADHSIIRIHHQLSRQKALQPPKTASSDRTIDIARPLLERMLELLRERDAEADPTALVFLSRNGTGLERKVCRGALDRAAAAANLRLPHPTLHDCRHSHASMLIALDYKLADVQYRLGHAKPDTTLRTYTHPWRHRDAQRSTIGHDLNTLLTG